MISDSYIRKIGPDVLNPVSTRNGKELLLRETVSHLIEDVRTLTVTHDSSLGRVTIPEVNQSDVLALGSFVRESFRIKHWMNDYVRTIPIVQHVVSNPVGIEYR